MARAIPGSAEILAIYGHRPRNRMEFAQMQERPHPLATLETVVQSPLMDLAVAGISRGMDEYDYYQRAQAEKERVKAANQGRNEELGAIRAEREELQSKLGAIPQSAIDTAMAMGQAGFTSPAPPGVEYLENVGPSAYPIGQIGSESRDVTGSPHGDFQRQVPVMGMAQPKPGGWGNYTYEQIQQMLSDQKRLEEAEAKVAPAVEGRFIPRTQEEFIIAIQSEKDPARRLELIQQARSAVDVQPTSLIEAVGGVKGREAQAAVHKAQQDADKAEAAAKAAEVEAKLAERDMKVKEQDQKSKAEKRAKEIAKLDKETQLLSKKLEKIARRAKANSALGRDTQKFFRIVGEYPGDSLPEKLKNAYADGGGEGRKSFQDKLDEQIGAKSNRVYTKILNQFPTIKKLSSKGEDSALKTQQDIRREQRKAQADLAGARAKVASLEAADTVDEKALSTALGNLAKAQEAVNQAGVDLTLSRNPGAYDENLQPTRKKKGAVDVPGVGRIPVTLGE